MHSSLKPWLRTVSHDTRWERYTSYQDKTMLQRPISTQTTSPGSTNHSVFGTFASSQAYKAEAGRTSGKQ
eukprot:7997187-Karenia_brevis.AAC.1